MSDLNVSKTQLTGPALAALKIRTEWSGPSLLSGKHETGQRGTMTDTRNSQRLSYKRNEKRKFCFVKHDASPKCELSLANAAAAAAAVELLVQPIRMQAHHRLNEKNHQAVGRTNI